MSLTTALYIVVGEVAIVLFISALPRSRRLRLRMMSHLAGAVAFASFFWMYWLVSVADQTGQIGWNLLASTALFATNGELWFRIQPRHNKQYGHPRAH